MVLAVGLSATDCFLGQPVKIVMIKIQAKRIGGMKQLGAMGTGSPRTTPLMWRL
tara:strand:+ start:804 stop:965 length:162 start_codon:yes stop_codon:yes gene_type:complete